MKFNVCLADPPWRFDSVKTGGSFTSGAEQQYVAPTGERTTLAVADILALPVPAILEQNAVLALWVPTTLKFSHGEPVLRAWLPGGVYKTTWYWKKTRIGMGYWGRNIVEELLIGVRGNIAPFMLQEPNARELPMPCGRGHQAVQDQCPACHDLRLAYEEMDGQVWLTIKAGEHSAKPDEFRAMLERATKQFSRRHQVELFGRKTVPGWTVLGNQIDGKPMRAALLDVYQLPQP